VTYIYERRKIPCSKIRRGDIIKNTMQKGGKRKNDEI
jgi:hypothetical protein